MNKFLCCALSAAAILCCTVSCGSRRVSTDGISVSVEIRSNKSAEEIISDVAGKWETASETLNGEKREAPLKRFTFADNGNGLYYDINGDPHQIIWSITDTGGIKLTYAETGETTENFDFSGSDLVSAEDISTGRLETRLKKVEVFTDKENIRQ